MCASPLLFHILASVLHQDSDVTGPLPVPPLIAHRPPLAFTPWGRFFFSSLAKSLTSCESCPAKCLLTLHLARSLPLFPLGQHSSSHYLASSTSWAPFGSISYLDRAHHLSKGTTGSWMYSTNIQPPRPPRFKTTFLYFHNSSTISHPYSIFVFSP